MKATAFRTLSGALNLVCLCFLVGVAYPAWSQNKIEALVESHRDMGDSFPEAVLFEVEDVTSKRPEQAKISDLSYLQPDWSALTSIREEDNDTLQLIVPRSGKAPLILDLVKNRVISEDFFVTTSDSNSPVPYTPGLYYRGVVHNEPGTLAAVSIFEDEVMAVVTGQEEGDMVLGRVTDSKNGQHVLYSTKDLDSKQAFVCDTIEPEGYRELMKTWEKTESNSLLAGCIKVYFECDYAMNQEKGGVTNTVNFLTGVYNVVATIYANESLTTVVGQTHVWTTMDNYSRTSSSAALNTFRGRPHSQNLAHLLARGGNGLGGVAWLDGLCNSNGYAYSNINATYSNLPTYSWTVGVIAHEMGHNMGSPHTHSCSWSGGALDNCYTPEGSCSRGPQPPAGGGTIMSYCHLNSTGINLSAGFGSQPGNLIRSRANNASCLGTCTTTTGCSGSVTLTAASGSFNDGSGSGNYPNNADCRWLIQPTGASSVTLSFSSFNTEASYDFVKVYNGSTTSAPLLGSWSGTSLPASVTGGGVLLVRFTSDGDVTAAGFAASYTSSTGGGGCSGTTTLTASSGSFSDGSGNSNYTNNLDCRWLIQPSASGRVRLNFSSFNTEANYDFVYVYSGSTTSSTLLGKFSGTSLPASLTASGNTMLVRFTSDTSVVAPGFSASYSLVP